jgi:hypothetical protein
MGRAVNRSWAAGSAAEQHVAYLAIRNCGCFVVVALRAAVMPLQDNRWLFCYSGAEPSHDARKHVHTENGSKKRLASCWSLGVCTAR